MMVETKFAEGASRLLLRKSRAATIATALVLLLAVVCVGALLANHAAHLQERLLQSKIVGSLQSPDEKNRLAQVLAAPETARLFVAYVDSIGEAAENLAITPRQSFLCFTALLDASRASGASLQAFSDNADGGFVSVRCAGAGDTAALFLQALDASNAFAKAELVPDDAENTQEFTIKCYFSQT